MAKMVLIEAHPLLRLGLHQILSNVEGVWEISSLGLDEVEWMDKSLSGVDLLVFGLPVDSALGWEKLRRAQSELKPERTLLLTDAMPWKMPSEGLPEGGILGCLMKTASVEVLEAAIKLVMAGGQCFPSSHMVQMAPAVVATQSAQDVDPAAIKNTMPVAAGAQLLKITPRQYEVLVLLARGYPIKTVSRLLNISVATAKTHACTLYQRLHVKNKGEAVYAALQRGAKLDWDPAMQPAVDQTYGMARRLA